jgi:hypothetical protein
VLSQASFPSGRSLVAAPARGAVARESAAEPVREFTGDIGTAWKTSYDTDKQLEYAG